MTNKEMVERLAELQILLVRDVERNTKLRYKTDRDLNRIITKNKLVCTYKGGVNNLLETAKKFSKNESLIENIEDLKEEILNSDIAELRFGLEPQRKFSDIESELDIALTLKQLNMSIRLQPIKEIVEELGINEETIKKACQSERLLNTKKVGRMWLVDVDEVKKYWNK